MRTDVGASMQATAMGGASQELITGVIVKPAGYIALSNVSLTSNPIASGDTTLVGEMGPPATPAFARRLGTFVYSSSGHSYTLTASFGPVTAADHPQVSGISRIGVFDAPGSVLVPGNMWFETALNPAPPNLNVGDTLTVTETVTL